MIKTISIFNHKSFHPTTPYAVQIDHNKTATYFYGLNGAGKSAIGEVVDGISRRDPEFSHCTIQTTDGGGYRYLVYNQSFVDRVIYEPMRGIFTVGEVDTARQQRISEVVVAARELDAQVTAADARVLAAAKDIEAEVERAKNEVWKAHELGKKTSLAELLRGYGRDSKKFFQDLRAYQPPADAELDSMERLEKRWADVSGTENERVPVSVDLAPLQQIESDGIWSEPVEVSSTSRLSALIARLANADWVAHGAHFVSGDHCPFCQQILPHDFKDELARLLEGERKAKVERIDSLVNSYSALIHSLAMRLDAILMNPEAAGTKLDLAWSELLGALNANLALMAGKRTNPSEVVHITPTQATNLKDAVAGLNALIADFNARIRDRKGERERIRIMFYQVLYMDRAEAYARHDAIIDPLRMAEIEAKAHRDNLLRALRTYDEELRELRRQQKGVDASIGAINERLKSLGIVSFSIQRHKDEERVYTLQRPGVASSDARSLSEGEKTLIAFLYFMETLRGSHDENENVDPGRTIAIIDDPISSLSQNYVYDIATMIHRELAKPDGRPKLVKQVIVLTHNLFFFHELHRQTKKACALRRVIKKDYTAVQDFDPSTLLNDYDAWWRILVDARAGLVPVQIVPNAMRCILEQFFTFTTGTDEIPDAIQKLADADTSAKYAALHRVVDRGSHRDGINGAPIDWTLYDVDYLLGKFRAMFASVGFEEHYLMKMGEGDAVVAKAA